MIPTLSAASPGSASSQTKSRAFERPMSLKWLAAPHAAQGPSPFGSPERKPVYLRGTLSSQSHDPRR
jgi:hypothetical protein